MRSCREQLGRMVALAAVLAALAGAGPAATKSTPASQIAAAAAEYRSASGAKVGIHVIRLVDGAVIAAQEAHTPLIPASNQKILTSAVALSRLGRDFRFRTRVGMAGADLVVIGDGDPATGDARLAAARSQTPYAAFDRWAAKLNAAGVKKVGDIRLLCGIFAGDYFHPDWPVDQRQRWYCAPVAAVNFNDNCLDVGFSIRDKQVQPDIFPTSRFLTVTNQVTVGAKHRWRCRFDAERRAITLSGSITAATPDRLPVAVSDPPVLFASVLADRLARAGIATAGKFVIAPERSAAEGIKIIATEEMEIGAVLYRANKRSLNMMAECLFLRSAAGKDDPVTWQAAAANAQTVLVKRYGLMGEEVVVSDGSGLSRNNRLSPAALTKILQALVSEKHFVRSLPVSGVDGSLGRRLNAAGIRGRVLAKTGSLNGVSALSGYVLDSRGRPALAFSLLINGSTYGKTYSAHRLQEAVCQVLVRAVDAAPTAGKAAK